MAVKTKPFSTVRLSAVNPETGDEYWSVPYEATSGSVIMSPVKSGEYLYVGGYQNKSLLLELAQERPAAEIVWRDKPQHGVSPINVQPIIAEGTMYGVDGNGDGIASVYDPADAIPTAAVVALNRTPGRPSPFIVVAISVASASHDAPTCFSGAAVPRPSLRFVAS